MLPLRSMFTVALVTLVACTSDGITGPSTQSPLPAPQPSAVTTLTGFVVAYSDDDVRLLTGGIEVRLLGAVDQVIPHGGSEVLVSGHFVSANVFWVDTAIALATGKPHEGEHEDK